MSNILSRLRGTFSNLFSIGSGTNKAEIKNSSGVVQFKNYNDSSYVNVQGADPSNAQDFVTKNYLDTSPQAASGGFIFRVQGLLTSATGSYDYHYITSATSVTKITLFRVNAGLGTTSVKIIKNGTTSISGTNYPTVVGGDGNYADDDVTFSAVSLSVGDYICLELESAEAFASDLFVKVE